MAITAQIFMKVTIAQPHSGRLLYRTSLTSVK